MRTQQQNAQLSIIKILIINTKVGKNIFSKVRNSENTFPAHVPEKTFEVPQWQIDEVRKSKEYYRQHTEELIGWDEAWKMIKTN